MLLPDKLGLNNQPYNLIPTLFEIACKIESSVFDGTFGNTQIGNNQTTQDIVKAILDDKISDLLTFS